MDVVLVGARGSGKTTIGRAVAARLRWSFVDLDDLVLRQLDARCVREVFEEHGEVAWRQTEEAVCARILASESGTSPRIIALGGGTPMGPQARGAIDLARHEGRVIVVYLHCAAATLAARLGRDAGDRPSLTGRPVQEEIAEILNLRESTYRAIADAVVGGDGSIEDCSVRVIELVNAGQQAMKTKLPQGG